jgi:hypothetical protein
MSNALSPTTAGTPQVDAEVRSVPGARVRVRQEKAARARAEWAQQERRRAELVAYAATPILAAAGVPDPAAHAHHVDEHLVRLGYLLTDPERHAADAASVDAHDRQHWPAMAISLTVYSATNTGRDWSACVRDGEHLLYTLAAHGITLTRRAPSADHVRWAW